jgi:hypothetical protein
MTTSFLQDKKSVRRRELAARPEARAKKRARSLEYHSRPEIKLAKREYDHRPEVRKHARNLKNGYRFEIIVLRGGECCRCGLVATFANQCIFDFHHLDPSKKLKKTTSIWTFEKLKMESEKCILLCANCHRMEHWNPEVNNGIEI